MSDEAKLWTALGRLGEDPLPGERSDAELVEAALAGLAEATADDVPVAGPIAEPHGPRRLAIAMGVVLAIAAAVVLGWWLVPSTGLQGERDDSHEMAPSIADDDAPEGQASQREEAERAAARGRRPQPTAPSPELEAPAVADTEASDTAAELDTSDTEPAPDDASDTETEPGTARPSRRASTPRTAAALLEHAQQQLSAGDRTAAIASFERLVDRFPKSAEAKAARVSLGRLELRRGRARQALAHFDAYLASSTGALTEEARYGRIRALRSLGRHAQELASIEAFLAEHGDGMYAARLRKRAEELRQ